MNENNSKENVNSFKEDDIVNSNEELSKKNSTKNKILNRQIKISENQIKKGDITDLMTTKYRPLKKSSIKTENYLLKAADKILNLSEEYLGKRMYICGNPSCGALIYFQNNSTRPVVCSMCGEGLDWEGEFTKKIKVCPKCNEEYQPNANFCSFHYPSEKLMEKEIPL